MFQLMHSLYTALSMHSWNIYEGELNLRGGKLLCSLATESLPLKQWGSVGMWLQWIVLDKGTLHLVELFMQVYIYMHVHVTSNILNVCETLYFVEVHS